MTRYRFGENVNCPLYREREIMQRERENIYLSIYIYISIERESPNCKTFWGLLKSTPSIGVTWLMCKSTSSLSVLLKSFLEA